MSNFFHLSAKELPDLMLHLSKSLPDTLPIYYSADNTIRGRLPLDEVQFYTSTWPNPLWVAVVSPEKNGQLCNYRSTVDLWCTDSGINESMKFLEQNTILNWKHPIFFRVQALSSTQLEEISRILQQKGGTVNTVERHIYSLHSLVQNEKSLHPGYRGPESLDQKDAEVVGNQYSAWGVNPADTVSYFQVCCQRLPSSGVHTDEGELVAYAVLHHTSALGSVVTDPRHRRKGLGVITVSDVCQKMLKDQQTPYVYVNPQNVPSAELYKKCGFQFKAVAHRIRFVPKDT